MHLTDLHFGAFDRAADIDNKAGVPAPAASGLALSPERQFLADLRRWCSGHEEGEERPQLLIVSGDLVTRGGLTEDGSPAAWGRVRQFLESVQDILSLRDDRVLVVPGNHDVNFRAPSREGMFRHWDEAMAGYPRPRLGANSRFEAYRSRIEGIVEGLVLTVVLLASPCYVGDVDADGLDGGGHDEYLDRLESLFVDVDDAELRGQITKALRAARGRMDIAAIGAQQRRFVQSLGPKAPGEVRIAVLHHHLLPDPQVEITPFEAVVDAGQTLAVLADGMFDLVVAGHKHHRRFATYTDAASSHPLHVYTGHSLFENGRTPPGATLIDVQGPDHPIVATIRFMERDLAERRDLETKLDRASYINPAIVRVCQTVDSRRQEEVLLPVLSGLALGLDRLSSDPRYTKAESLFDRVVQVAREDLTKLGRGTMVLRPPALAEDWARLLEAVALGADQRIRLVSDSDLEYWAESIEPEGEPAAYAAALRRCPERERILVLRRGELGSSEAERIIDHMVGDGYRIYTVPYETVDRDTWTDFGILGDLCVSRFLGRRDGTDVRALEETFEPDALKAANAHWHDLLNNPQIREYQPAT